jgi:hypothetical protein
MMYNGILLFLFTRTFISTIEYSKSQLRHCLLESCEVQASGQLYLSLIVCEKGYMAEGSIFCQKASGGLHGFDQR